MAARRVGAVLALVLAAGALPVTPTLGAAENVALLIGNSRYERATPLRNPAADAGAVGAALARLGFRTTVALDVTRDAADRALESYASSLPAQGVVLFFYAGHGLQIDGRNYLVPVDFDPGDSGNLGRRLVALDAVLERLDAGDHVTLVFLDACRDNPLAGEMVSRQREGRSLALAAGQGIGEIGRGLAEVRARMGTLVAFATAPGSVAADGTADHSPFTAGLLRHIESPGLEVDRLLGEVTRDVNRATLGAQTPWRHSSLTGPCYLRRKHEQPAPPP